MPLSVASSHRRHALRLLAGIAGLCTTLPALASGYLTRLLDKPVPGGVAVIALGEAGPAPEVTYEGKRVLVAREDGVRWIAVVGIPLKAKPGRHAVQVKSGGASRSVAFTVGKKDYKIQRITVKNPRHVNPLEQDLKRIERELAEQNRAYQQFRPTGPSNLALDHPVQGRLSSPFGLRRIFNGEERNPHSGLDFAVPTGTPIKAPAAGVVTLVGDYFFNGKTVFVDHGQGFISMFCHLSAIDVVVGQEVPRGGVVGKVGATGRATGPHLHWNISLNDARVDPAIFIGAFKP